MIVSSFWTMTTLSEPILSVISPVGEASEEGVIASEAVREIGASISLGMVVIIGSSIVRKPLQELWNQAGGFHRKKH